MISVAQTFVKKEKKTMSQKENYGGFNLEHFKIGKNETFLAFESKNHEMSCIVMEIFTQSMVCLNFLYF